MAKGRYAVVGGAARKVKKRYAVIGGVTRKIKKRYAVVGGVTRLIWSGSPFGSRVVGYFRHRPNTTVTYTTCAVFGDNGVEGVTGWSAANSTGASGNGFTLGDKYCFGMSSGVVKYFTNSSTTPTSVTLDIAKNQPSASALVPICMLDESTILLHSGYGAGGSGPGGSSSWTQHIWVTLKEDMSYTEVKAGYTTSSSSSGSGSTSYNNNSLGDFVYKDGYIYCIHCNNSGSQSSYGGGYTNTYELRRLSLTDGTSTTLISNMYSSHMYSAETDMFNMGGTILIRLDSKLYKLNSNNTLTLLSEAFTNGDLVKVAEDTLLYLYSYSYTSTGTVYKFSNGTLTALGNTPAYHTILGTTKYSIDSLSSVCRKDNKTVLMCVQPENSFNVRMMYSKDNGLTWTCNNLGNLANLTALESSYLYFCEIASDIF